MIRNGLRACCLFSLILVLGGCPRTTTPTPTTSAPPPQLTSFPYALSWEASHPERQAWTKALAGILAPMLPDFAKAGDITFFCPPYAKLTSDQKQQALGEIVAQDSFYESSWNPAIYAVDAGDANNHDTWSVGLEQVSVTDQKNHGYKFGYTFEDLKTPIPNLTLAMNILHDQVLKRGAILIAKGSPGLYWSTLCPGGKYDRSQQIAAKTKALPFCQ